MTAYITIMLGPAEDRPASRQQLLLSFKLRIVIVILRKILSNCNVNFVILELMKKTNPKFGDFFEKESNDDEADERNKKSRSSRESGLDQNYEDEKDRFVDTDYQRVGLDKAKSERMVKKEQVSESLYLDLLKNLTVEDVDDNAEKLAECQKKIIQEMLKYGPEIIDGLEDKLEHGIRSHSEFINGDLDIDPSARVEGRENGIKSVYKYITNRREELDQNQAVESFEISFRVDWDADYGVDVVERLELIEEVDADTPYRLNLVQIKTSEKSDPKGHDDYFSKHRSAVENLKGKNFLSYSLLKQKSEKLADSEIIKDFESGTEAIKTFDEFVTENTGVSFIEAMTKDEDIVFTQEDAQKIIWDIFTSTFSNGDELEFKYFCALVSAGGLDPTSTLRRGLSATGKIEKILENEFNVDKDKIPPTLEYIESVKKKTKKEIDKISTTFSTKDYYAISCYYVAHTEEGEKMNKRVITDIKNNEVIPVHALEAREDKINDLYDQYQKHAD
jgi:hypothetical protein